MKTTTEQLPGSSHQVSLPNEFVSILRQTQFSKPFWFQNWRYDLWTCRVPTTTHSGMKRGREKEGRKGSEEETVCERKRDRERKQLRAWRLEIGLQSEVQVQVPNHLHGWRPVPKRTGQAWLMCRHSKALPELLPMEAGTVGHSACRRYKEQARLPRLPSREGGAC